MKANRNEEVIKLDESIPSMLTTIDNPFNPHINYDEWRNWDRDNGYNTEEAIGRFSPIVDDPYDEISQQNAIDTAYELILEFDPLGVYVLVFNDGSIDDMRFSNEEYEDLK